MTARTFCAQFCAAFLFAVLAITAPLRADEPPPTAIIPSEGQTLFGASVAGDVDTLFVGAPLTDGLSGAVHLFYREFHHPENEFGFWRKHQVLRPTYAKALKGFGNALTFEHFNVVAVSTLDGPVFVFERKQFSYDYEQVSVLEMPEGAEFQPDSMMLTTYVRDSRVISALAIGLNVDGPVDEAGSVLLYERNDTGWELRAKIRAGDPEPGALFGSAVAMVGGYMMVGAPGAADSAGAVYMFEQVDGVWLERQKITSPNAQPNNRFGESLATNIGQIIVGEPGDGAISDTTGRAYIFEWRGNTPPHYNLLQELVPTDPLPAKGRFGLAVGIDGNNRDIVVTQLAYSPSLDLQQPGSAHVFTLTVNGWEQRFRLAPTAGQFPGAFGSSLAVASVHAVIGDYGTTEKPGSVYVYDLTLPETAPFFVEAPEDQNVNAPPGEAAEVTFEVTVADEDGADMDVVWEVDGVSMESDFVDGEYPFTVETVAFTATLQPGLHRIRVIAQERSRDFRAVHEFTVRVGDFEGPVIHSIVANPSTIPSQHGRFVLVRLKVDATDPTGPVRWRVTKVESSDPSAPKPHHLPDWLFGFQRHSVLVRADTTDPKRNRIYTIHIEAIDAAGNTTQGKTTVTILAKPDKKPNRR